MFFRQAVIITKIIYGADYGIGFFSGGPQVIYDFIILLYSVRMMAAVNKTPDLLQRDAGVFAEEDARQYQRLLGKIVAIFIFSGISGR